MSNTSGRTGRRDERGATLITFALSLVAICTVIALVIGGSLGYSAERDSQTASDAAALAATSKLRAYQLGEAGAEEVAATAQLIAESNGADGADRVICEVVNADYAQTKSAADVIGPCEDPSAGDPYVHVRDADAAGVRLGTGETKDVPFGEVSELRTIAANTIAAATVQPLRSGNSPFLLCSSTGGDDGHEVKVLEETAPYEVNEAAYDKWFMLWGEDMNNGDRQCGGESNSWRGWVANSDDVYQLPGWWEVDTGNANGHLVPRLVIDPDGCDVEEGADISEVDGCVIVVPLCSHSNNETGNNLELYCVRYGTFELSYHDNRTPGPVPCARGVDNANKVLCGKFLRGGVATGGQGGTGQAGINEVVVIKLVE